MTRQIVAMGGGGFSEEPDNPLLDDYVLGLVDKATPTVCFVPTASGDSEGYMRRFHAAFERRARTLVLPLFRREILDLDAFLREIDIIYVGGGNTANLLALWRLHGLDQAILRRPEIVLTGLSAGALCWFEAGISDSFGDMRPMRNGLGLVRASLSVHYDSEALRRPSFHQAIRDGLPAGFAADDGAALHFVDGELANVVTSRPAAGAYRVEVVEGVVVETALASQYLGARVKQVGA